MTEKKQNFVFLVDATGGLNVRQAGSNELKTTLSHLAAVSFASELTKAFAMASGFFGRHQGVVWHSPYDLQNPEMLRRLGGHHLFYGTFLHPAIAEVKRAAEIEPVHLVIITDPNICGLEETRGALENFLKSSPRSTLDVILFGKKGGSFELALKKLKDAFPQQVGKTDAISLKEVSENIFSEIMHVYMNPPKKLPALDHKSCALG